MKLVFLLSSQMPTAWWLLADPKTFTGKVFTSYSNIGVHTLKINLNSICFAVFLNQSWLTPFQLSIPQLLGVESLVA